MVYFKDFFSVNDIQKSKISAVSIISIETLNYQDGPGRYYRVWYRA